MFPGTDALHRVARMVIPHKVGLCGHEQRESREDEAERDSPAGVTRPKNARYPGSLASAGLYKEVLAGFLQERGLPWSALLAWISATEVLHLCKVFSKSRVSSPSFVLIFTRPVVAAVAGVQRPDRLFQERSLACDRTCTSRSSLFRSAIFLKDSNAEVLAARA